MQTAVSTLDMPKSEWLRLRQRGLGSSDVGAVVGVSKYKTALEVYNEKISEEVVEIPETPNMRRGNLMEDLVADEYAGLTRRRIIRDNKIRLHPEHPFMLCNLDRIIIGEERGVGILEIKTVSSMALKYWEEEVPLAYWSQIQHQLYVTGYQWAVFAVLVIDTWELRTFPVERNEEYIAAQNTVLFEFWNDHVVPGIPPEAVASDFAQMDSEPDKTSDANDEIIIMHGTLNQLREQRKSIEAREEAIITQLQEYMGTAEVLQANGSTLCTWKSSKPSVSVDSKKLKSEMPDVFTKYSVTKSGSRRFSVKGNSNDNE